MVCFCIGVSARLGVNGVCGVCILCECVGWWCPCIVGVDGGLIVNCCRFDVRRDIVVSVVVVVIAGAVASKLSRLLSLLLNTAGAASSHVGTCAHTMI